MTEAFELFRSWLLIACASFGTPPPATVDTVITSGWARVCLVCDERTVGVSPDTLCYGDEEFIRLSAFHEAAHLFLNHDREALKNMTVEAMEKEVDELLPKALGVMPHYIDMLQGEAKRWYSLKAKCNPVKHLSEKEKAWRPERREE